jgi:hypothetical protein
MAKNEYDIESRLQLFVLMESIEAAARKNDPSLASQVHEKMALQFVPPHAGCRGHCGDQIERLAAQDIEGGFRFRRLQDDNLFPGNAGRRHGRGDVVLHHVPFLRLPERAVCDPMDVANGARRKTFAQQRGVEFTQVDRPQLLDGQAPDVCPNVLQELHVPDGRPFGSCGACFHPGSCQFIFQYSRYGTR